MSGAGPWDNIKCNPGCALPKVNGKHVGACHDKYWLERRKKAPLPWCVLDRSDDDEYPRSPFDPFRFEVVSEDTCYTVASDLTEDEAGMIVEACNAHDTLRAENERLRDALELIAANTSSCISQCKSTGDVSLLRVHATVVSVQIMARAALKGGGDTE